MNILLVDDLANKGWSEITKKVLELSDSDLQSISTVDGAKKVLNEEKFDLILLDLRFGEKDHINHEIEQFGGYEILKSIKKDFNSINYSTPVILFTATNKIWNIHFMIEEGVDDFYIKEHPDYSYDTSFSKNNYLRFKNAFLNLLETGKQKYQIWKKIRSIITSGTFYNDNIKGRVEEKLKIGYGILFRKVTNNEQEVLLFNKEVISFIVFFSILEEIAKDSFKDHWDKGKNETGMKNNRDWKLQNDEIFIENNEIDKNKGNYKLGIKWIYDKKKYIKKIEKYEPKKFKKKPRFSGIVNLREQIFAVLLLLKGWDSDKAKKFDSLNNYRNKNDFIHSSNRAIFKERLVKNQDDEAYKKVVELINFIHDVLVEN